VPVTDALVRSEHETVLMALVRNATAKISHASYETLVQKSRALTGLQEPLVGRPDLPPQLANKMCEWVSDALQSYIKTHYSMAPKTVEAALSQARLVVKSEPAGPHDPPAGSAQKLVEKMAAAGQLKAGFLMRVLSQGQTDLFDLAFARLVGLELNLFRKTFYEGGARQVALACHAASIDRSVFPTVFNLSRQARGLTPGMSSADLQAAEPVFSSLSRQSALGELQNTKI
jgi:uncharacterized protein (DUF2336 family)